LLLVLRFGNTCVVAVVFGVDIDIDIDIFIDC